MSRILLAEDDPALRRLLAAILEEAGHRVLAVADGEAAAEALQAFTPDLVVTDILMPRRDGLELIRAIRGSRAGTPILAISGGGTSGMDEVLRFARLLGADATLAKPFGLVELHGAVDRLLQERPLRRAA